jgi:[ribosomal protein S5]-alanine N-acetyltransferase
VFLRASPREDQRLYIAAGRFLLRPPRSGDFPAWSRLRLQSRAFLEPWEPLWPPDELTIVSYKRRLRRYDREIEKDDAYPFFVFEAATGALLGGLTLSNIRRGVAQSASLGYWMGKGFAGQGIMTAAVDALTDAAFSRLHLRRIEAACLPENAASMRLLEKAGFRREGVAREYLCIAGEWRDHVLFALLASDKIGGNGGTPDAELGKREPRG